MSAGPVARRVTPAVVNISALQVYRSRHSPFVRGALSRGPAARGGVQPGEVVLAVAGQEIADASAFRRALADAPGGGRLRLELLREGRRVRVEIEVEELPRARRG